MRVGVTCTASNASVFSAPVQGGLLFGINYTKASASAFATGSTCTISFVGNTSSVDMDVSWDIMTFTGSSLSQVLYPRREMQTTAGASAGAMGGVMIPLVDGRVKINVASGGANGRGTFDLLIEGVI